MDEPLTILLINFHSPQNAGDLALLQATIDQLNNNFSKPNIIVSTNDPYRPVYSSLHVSAIPSIDYLINQSRSPTIVHKLIKFGFTLLLCAAIYLGIKPRRQPAHWQRLFDSFNSANLVVSCPGNHFLTMGRINWPLMMTSLSITLAICFHKPLYIMPQSLGPLKRGWEKHLLYHLYNYARYVFVREKVSLELGLRVGLSPQKIIYLPDPAFSPPVIEVEERKTDQSLKIGVTVISGMTRSLNRALMDRYYSALADSLSIMVDKFNAKIYFFAQVVGPTAREDDRNAIRQVMDLMAGYKDNLFANEEVLSPIELKRAYGAMDIFIASRLHSGIFSTCQYVPTLFIGYLTKTKGIIDCMAYSDWFIPIEEITNEKMDYKLTQIINKRPAVKKYLQDILPGLISQTSLAGRLIAEDYNKGCQQNRS